MNSSTGRDLRPATGDWIYRNEAGVAVGGRLPGPHHVTELLAGAQLVEEGGGHDVVVPG